MVGLGVGIDDAEVLEVVFFHVLHGIFEGLGGGDGGGGLDHDVAGQEPGGGFLIGEGFFDGFEGDGTEEVLIFVDDGVVEGVGVAEGGEDFFEGQALFDGGGVGVHDVSDFVGFEEVFFGDVFSDFVCFFGGDFGAGWSEQLNDEGGGGDDGDDNVADVGVESFAGDDAEADGDATLCEEAAAEVFSYDGHGAGHFGAEVGTGEFSGAAS